MVGAASTQTDRYSRRLIAAVLAATNESLHTIEGFELTSIPSLFTHLQFSPVPLNRRIHRAVDMATAVLQEPLIQSLIEQIAVGIYLIC
jgi:hypothetical protein